MKLGRQKIKLHVIEVHVIKVHVIKLHVIEVNVNNMLKTMLCGALLVATRFWPINWVNINIFEWNQLDMKGKPKLHKFLYEYQLNIFKQLTSFKIIELKRVSIFFH